MVEQTIYHDTHGISALERIRKLTSSSHPSEEARVLLLKRLLRPCLNSSSGRELIIPEAAHSIFRQQLLSPKSAPSNFRLMVLVLSIEAIG